MGKKARPRAAGKQGTRDALIDAALAEFAEHGLDAPSLDSICARAGFTRGAFHFHFADREALVVAAIDKTIGGFLDAVIATGKPDADLAETVSRFADAVKAGAPMLHGAGAVRFHHTLEACVRSEPIRERYGMLLRGAIARVAGAAKEGQAAGTVRADVDAGAAGMVLVAVAMGAVAMIEAGIPFDVEQGRGALLALLSPAAPPGR